MVVDSFQINETGSTSMTCVKVGHFPNAPSTCLARESSGLSPLASTSPSKDFDPNDALRHGVFLRCSISAWMISRQNMSTSRSFCSKYVSSNSRLNR